MSETGAAFELTTFSGTMTIDCSARGSGGSLVGSFIPAALSASIYGKVRRSKLLMCARTPARRGEIWFLARSSLVEVAEGVVDALGGLQTLRIADQGSVDIGRIFLFFDGEMVGTQMGVLVGGKETALAARGSEKLAASEKCRGISGL